MRPSKPLTGAKGAFFAIISLWLAGGLQQGLADQMEVFRVTPDFVLVTVVVLGLFAPRAAATGIGFAGGVIQGASVGTAMAAFAVSKTIVGFLAGTAGVLELDASPTLAFFATAALTLIARIGWMFLSPHGSIGSFLLATITLAVYNGVIAVPIFALLKRALDPGGR